MNLDPVFCRVSYIPGGNLDFLKQFGSRQEKMEITFEALLGESSIVSWVDSSIGFGKWQSFWAGLPDGLTFLLIRQVKNMVSIVQNKIRMLVFLIGFGFSLRRGGNTWGWSSSLGDFSAPKIPGFQKVWYLKQKIGLGRTSKRCVKFLSLYLWRKLCWLVGWLVGWFEVKFGWPASCQAGEEVDLWKDKVALIHRQV